MDYQYIVLYYLNKLEQNTVRYYILSSQLWIMWKKNDKFC